MQHPSFVIPFPNGKELSLIAPQVMGIINLAPDSFFPGCRCESPEQALQLAQQQIAQGATIIDIGAEPTNPSLTPNTSAELELERLVPTISLLRKHLDIPISVDTSKPEVMQEVVSLGADMINDVRALREEGALVMAAQLQVPVCLMHMLYPKGAPDELPQNRYPNGVTRDVLTFLSERTEDCLKAGIARHHIIIDPGFGARNFGKDTQDNLQLISEFEAFHQLNLPILIGVSRKTFIGEVLDVPVDDRLIGSIAASVIMAYKGAHIIRTHDVKATVQALRMTQEVNRDHYDK